MWLEVLYATKNISIQFPCDSDNHISHSYITRSHSAFTEFESLILDQ